MKTFNSALIGLALISSLAFAGCSSSDEAATTDKTQATTAAQEPAQAEAPDLTDAIGQYRQFVVEQSDKLVTETTAFVEAVKAGDIAKAQALYAPTRAYYERIEPVAESFDNLDPDIDAREGDVPANEWKGFHVLEKALWETKATKGLEAVADELLKNTQLLRAKVETIEIDPALFVTGAVELLNEVSTSKVTGEEERYSHTDLYDFAANVEGAQKIFELVQPSLQKQDAALTDKIAQRFTELNNALAKYKQGEGYSSYTVVTPQETKNMSQLVDALAEPLSQMGSVLGV